MANYLKSLSQIKTPDLIEFDRDSLVEEIVLRIQADPNWSSIWDGELLHNFSYFIINTFSYLFSKNAEATNRILKEVFITSASDPQSVINYLSNFSLNLKQNTASVTEVTIRPSLGGSFTNDFFLDPGYSIEGTTINGNSSNFEIYNYEKDSNGNITSKIDYRSFIEIPAKNFHKVNVFSGITKQISFSINPLTQTEKFIYNITDTNIIEDSIRIYYEINTINENELIETDSFIITPVINNIFTEEMGGVPHFKIKYATDGSAKIIFGSREFGGSFPSNGGNITIFYRIGGGVLSNVARGGINYTIDLVIDNFTTTRVNFFNFLAGGGGGDRETLDEAQFYAPYRIGRGRSLVDDNDVLNLLRGAVIKHIVKSPKYNGTDIPILHYHNYIAPPKNFNNFLFPVPNSTDTYLTYKEIFELELSKFLNLDGIHDGSENDIIITFFRNSSFSFALPYSPPLNGTLYVSAYDNAGIEVDRLIWGGNYQGSINLADPANVNASIISESVIPNLGITQGKQFLYFNIDEQIGNFTSSAGINCFRIEIGANQYSLDTNGKATALAEEIDLKIRSISTYFSSFSENTPFAYINDDNKMVIRSLSTGLDSSVQLYNFATDSILSTITFIPQKVLAIPQSRKVFLETSNYNADIQEININLNTSEWSQEKIYDGLVSIWENPEILTGPIITLFIVDENNDPILPQNGTSLVIEAIQNGIVNDTLTFSSLNATTSNLGASNSGLVFDDNFTNTCVYTPINGKIIFKLINSNLEGPDYSFPVSEGDINLYDTTTRFRITFLKKNYNFITVSMTPNPYFAESEASSYLSKLNSNDKKTIGVQALLKKVIFKPILIELSITPSKGYSRQEAINDTLSLVYSNFSYNNMIEDISIGTGFKIQTLKSFLNNKIRLPSVETIEVNLPVSDFTDPNENYYYFILNESFLSKIRDYESTYPQITGLYDSYKLRVIIA